MCSEDVTGQGGRPISGFQADFEACFGIDVTAGGKNIQYSIFNIQYSIFNIQYSIFNVNEL